ncbi:hypothetical protein VE03_01229 [Pseudogymnoascus sp. 23342-1-I1]|nr:hypothetical protein VE03_01229 [Pseudogymnoascus sp. 23342-1-I1]
MEPRARPEGIYGTAELFDPGVSKKDIALAENLLSGNPLVLPSVGRSAQHEPSSMNQHNPLGIPSQGGPAQYEPSSMNQPNPLGIPSQGDPVQYEPSRMSQQSENLPPNHASRRYNATSNTWTTSSGEVSEIEDIGDRSFYVEEFNKIGHQHGIPELNPNSHDYESVEIEKASIAGKAGSWTLRKIIKRTTSMLSINKTKPDPKPDVKHKRSFSDISLRMAGAKKDAFKDRHLAEVVRLCGSSPFYLPDEYTPGTLRLPTCFRATAQYLAQNGPTIKGIFRISGSHAAVAALYDHYASQDEDGDVISDTVRCPRLPEHIKCDEHDVAATFKKFLSGLPGGILGKVWLFDALVAIHDQMGVAPEFLRTKESKVKARLIACAVAAHPSRFQRDLICAVFGLLCLIGRASETALREDEYGRPLPTNELMGYGPLGMVFGPLLVGDLIDECNPISGDVMVETFKGPTLPKKKSKHWKPKSAEESLLETKAASDKLKIAAGVAEMVITNWRDVTRQMKKLSNTGSLLVLQNLQERGKGKHIRLRPSASESVLKHPPGLYPVNQDQSDGLRERSDLPTPTSRGQDNGTHVYGDSSEIMFTELQENLKNLFRRRSRPQAQPGQKLSGSKSMSALTPPREEGDSTDYEQVRFSNRVPKATEEEIVSAGHPLYQDLIEASSENTATPELRVAPANTLLDEPLIGNSNLSLRQAAIVGSLQQVETLIKTEETQGPAEVFAPNDNITTTTVEQSQDNDCSTEGSETSETTGTTKDAENKDDTMQLKKKQPIAKWGTPKASKASKFSSANQQSDVEDDLPPRTSHIPGVSPSEHLEWRKHDQALIASSRGNNGVSSTSQQSDADNGLPPRVSRIPGQSPSEHLERMLSANIPESVGKNSPAYKSTGSVFRSGGSSHLAARPRGSLMMSEVESGSGSVRVSHEQDMASLASLAQVLKSESNDEFQSFEPSSNTTEFATDSGNVGYTPTNGSSHKRTESEGAGSMKANHSAKRASFPADLKWAPVNQVASAKKNTAAGIKSLIGKFNSVEQDAARSPVTVGGRYSIQFPITAPSAYAMDSSPILPRSTLNFSNGFGNEASQMEFDTVVASPRNLPPTKIPRPVSASLLSITHQGETQLPFKALQPTKMHASYMEGGFNSSPVQPSLGLLRDGGGNENVGTPERPDKDKNRSKTAEITIWDDSNTTPEPGSTSVFSNPQPSVDLRSYCSAIPAEVKPGLSAAAQTPTTPAVGTGAQGRINSVLFTQITNLQRLLEIRAEEADNLRKQLATKGSLNDLSTLAEQLREAKRDTAMWQKRAEMAERHIERMSQFNATTISEAMGEESAYLEVDATRVAGLHEFPGQRDFHALDNVSPAQRGNVDGARSSAESTDTQGTTIMRTIPELRELTDESDDEDDSVATYGTFGKEPEKEDETSGEDLITFSETD